MLLLVVSVQFPPAAAVAEVKRGVAVDVEAAEDGGITSDGDDGSAGTSEIGRVNHTTEVRVTR